MKTKVCSEEQAYNLLGLYIEDVLRDLPGSRSALNEWMQENGLFLEKGVVYMEDGK